ncbi:YwqJ-like deaminase OS=Streptomyces violarus OX=67380 GN=FHS41_006826 PE=4 SV=1 [Streptomyces violarus]
MNATQTGPHRRHRRPTKRRPPGQCPTRRRPTHRRPRSGDPTIGWSAAEAPHAPVLHHRRDGILPTVAAALSVRGATLTGTAAPPAATRLPALHPLVQDFLDTLTSAQRDRFTGRCAETILSLRHITAADAARSKRAARKA